MHWCWTKGQIVLREEVGVSLTDLGLRRGYGLFDFMRTYDGAIFMQSYHIAKFLHSAQEELFLNLATSPDELEKATNALAKKAGRDVGITLLATAGASDDLYTPMDRPELFAYTSDLPKRPQEPIHTLTLDYERPWARTKTFHYFPAQLKLRESNSPRIKEVLYQNRKQELLEASRSNLFALRGSQLITPSEDVLLGATRKITIEIAEKMGYTIDYRGIRVDELASIDGLFITSTIREILPIARVDAIDIPVSSKIYELHEAFKGYVRQNAVAKI